MAGFFGLFNYEKEGPGIYKDGPKKKGFVVFFETFFRNFWKFITANLVFCLLSIPIVTNGLACVGLTNITRNIARDKHSFGLSDFFDTVKKNWKQALAAGIINTVVFVMLAFDLYFFRGATGIMGTVGIGIVLCLLFIFLIMNFYIWTLIITFKFKLSQVYKNSFKFVFINMKMNLLCGIVLLLVYALYVAVFWLLPQYIVLTIELILILCTLPAFKFLLIQFCIFPSIKKYIIDPYYEEHPDDDIEQRKNLGLEVGKKHTIAPDDEENGIVFED